MKVGELSSGWSPSQVSAREWECLSTLDVSPTDPDAVKVGGKARSSKAKSKAPGFRLFTMARGVGEDDVRFVRLKLTATDEEEAQKGAVLLAERVAALFAALTWHAPERVLLGAKLRQPFVLDDQGTSVRFIKERMNDFSYNLILEFPKRPEPTIAKAESGKAVGDGTAPDEKKSVPAGEARASKS
ncbi:hypothetical protein ASG54_05660 [Aureimonas sp. Leaf460]|nr:hypothetical protein ASG62_00135 [Aureimonas sp. Leaf427]KQT80942.1 hypothetical protein ASG54_05660 [Aureimonas sp. Leaf460]